MTMYGDGEMAAANGSLQQNTGWLPDGTTTMSQIIGDAEGCVHHLCFVVGADALVTVIARGASVYELLVQLDAGADPDKCETQITGSYTIYVIQTAVNALQDERGTVLLPGERHPFSHFSTDGLAELPAFDVARPLHCFRITPPALSETCNEAFAEELSLTKVLRSADETCVELVFGEDETHASLSHFGAVGITHTVYDAAHTDEQPAECEELQLSYAKMIVLPVGSQRVVSSARAGASEKPVDQRAMASKQPMGARKAQLASRGIKSENSVAAMHNVSSIAQDPVLMAQTLAATRKLVVKDVLVPLQRVSVTDEQRSAAQAALQTSNSGNKLPNAERLAVGPIRCQLCGESWRTVALYKEHVMLQHQNGCPLCSHKFQTKSRLLVHYPVCVKLKNEQVTQRIKAYRERLAGRIQPEQSAEKRVRVADHQVSQLLDASTPKSLAVPRGASRSSVITRRQYVTLKQQQQQNTSVDSAGVYSNVNVVLVGPEGALQASGPGPYEFSEAAEMSVVGAAQGGPFTAELLSQGESADAKYVYVTQTEPFLELGGDVKVPFVGGTRSASKGHNAEKQRGEYICKFCNRVCRNLIGLKSHITQGHREFYNKLLQYTLLKAQQIQLETGQPGASDPSQQLVTIVDQQTGQMLSTYESAEARLSVFSQDQIRAAFERVLSDVDIGSTQIMADIKQEQMRSLAEYFGSPSELKELRAAQNASNSSEAMIMYRERIHQTADLLKHMPRQRSDCHRRGLWNVMDVERLMELIPNQLDDTAVEELPLRFKRQRFSVRNKPKVAASGAGGSGREVGDDNDSESGAVLAAEDAADDSNADADGLKVENRSRSLGKAGVKFRGAARSTKEELKDSQEGVDEMDVQVTDLTDEGLAVGDTATPSASAEKRRPLPSHDDYVTRCRILDGRIECCECLQTFKHRGSLIKHRRRIHINKLRLICPHCSKAFAEKPAFEDHMNVHNNERPHVCEVCREAFATRNQLWTHSMRADHANGTFAQRNSKHCEECGLTFKNQFYLQVHQNAAHSKPLIGSSLAAGGGDDSVKPKTLARRPLLPSGKMHSENETSNASEITVDDLDVNLAAAEGKAGSKRPLRPADSSQDAGEGGEQVMYRCGVCDALFSAYDDVVTHQDEMQRAQDAEAAGSGPDPQQVQYLCKICELYFASECMANRHVRDHHP